MTSENAKKAALVVLASGDGSNLQAILDACAARTLPARVACVVCNRKAARAIDRAETAGVPVLYHPLKWYTDTGRTRVEYDADLAAQITEYAPDWIVLAGWMHVLSMAFLGRFPGKVINLHPALPGQFPGTHAIERAYEAYSRGEITETGVMVHFVPDEGVDVGAPIATGRVSFVADESLESFTARMHVTEHDLLIEALRKLIQVRI
ncbi:MAG: phosphoribosylglycinamide formyltransferase [Aggregatilineales bacterium]